MTSDFAPFTVRAPASTANFGSAFDAVGMALDLWLELRVEAAEANRFEIRGEGENEISGPANSNLIFRAAYIGAARLGAALPPMRITASNAIPLARGLGSSAAACAAGLLIANKIVGRESEMDDMIADATRIEGHPDNVAPALMGGACLAVISDDGRPVARQLEFPLTWTVSPLCGTRPCLRKQPGTCCLLKCHYVTPRSTSRERHSWCIPSPPITGLTLHWRRRTGCISSTAQSLCRVSHR